MRIRTAILAMAAAAAVVACDSYSSPTDPYQPGPSGAVLLKDMVVPHLPSPYYHFEYDAAGRIKLASFASGFTMYDVTYSDGRLDQMQNVTAGNHDRLKYIYDPAGRPLAVKYIDPNGVLTAVVIVSLDGNGQLSEIERSRRVEGGLIIDKTMTFTYYADGNLATLTEHWPAIAGRQPEATTVDRFEQYDDGINVDAFGLLHDEFFDHLVLLPDVHLQKGNPARQIHTGDGVNFTVDYTYTYDDHHRPLAKNGTLVYQNGPEAGRVFSTSSQFSYY